MKVKTFCVLLLVISIIFLFISIIPDVDRNEIVIIGIIDALCLGYWGLIEDKEE